LIKQNTTTKAANLARDDGAMIPWVGDGAMTAAKPGSRRIDALYFRQ
jgi:hypothetical protein